MDDWCPSCDAPQAIVEDWVEAADPYRRTPAVRVLALACGHSLDLVMR